MEIVQQGDRYAITNIPTHYLKDISEAMRDVGYHSMESGPDMGLSRKPTAKSEEFEALGEAIKRAADDSLLEYELVPVLTSERPAFVRIIKQHHSTVKS